MQGGTPQKLRNLIGWRNISTSTDVTGHVNEVEEFIELVVRCHLIMSGLHYFSMNSLTDKPHSNVFLPTISPFLWPRGRTIFLDHLLAIIDRYVIPRKFHTEKLQERLQPQPEEVRQNPCTALLLTINMGSLLFQNYHVGYQYLSLLH